jgi:hypothetical protein
VFYPCSKVSDRTERQSGKGLAAYFVSGQRNHVQIPERREKHPKKMNVPYPMCWIIGGVIKPMMKLNSQFAHVVMATPFALREEEWTSAARGCQLSPRR